LRRCCSWDVPARASRSTRCTYCPGLARSGPARSPPLPSGASACVRRLAWLREAPAQFGLQHLAVVVLRQRIDEEIAPRPLEARDHPEAMRVERRLVHRGARPGADEGDDPLAPARIGLADDRDLGDIRMREQRLLDLARIDVGATADHQVLRAVLEREVTVDIELAEIARP